MIQLFTEVNVFDGSVGRDGAYVWKTLPNPMTRREADDYAGASGWCPPERYRTSPGNGGQQQAHGSIGK
ncbi:hypothetical protein [Burkholderia gladioli]|uniref:hypothetical protein n=1 Tax=Burkholderia gladioli TaxID=28095 RepID=UPI001640015B|nr:hypothetical protein [Burkholderia gladioli]